MSKNSESDTCDTHKNEREKFVSFLKWINDWEQLGYTEYGIKFYVDQYLKQQKKS